jgi:hypothetical protein
MIVPRPLRSTLLALLAACGSDPSGPSTGSLAVAVTGLPAGTVGAVTVTGPGGYRHSLGASEVLPGLVPGSYAVKAEAVTGIGESYEPAQALQSIMVEAAATPVSAEVAYGIVGASLLVTITGLPPDAPAAVTVSGPGGYQRALAATATLSGLAAGVYTVAAASVSPSPTSYDPTPATQSVNLATRGSGSAGVSYTQAAAAGFNLRIDGMYLTQSVQTYGGAVPLVQNRDAYLRVFVTANETNLATPQVRVTFYHDGVQTSQLTLDPPGLSVPLSPDEASLSASWNVPVPKALIRPNLSILAVVDPGNAVTESDETDNSFPTTGTPLALDVRATSAFSVELVPILQSANGRQGNVTDANKDGYLAAAMRLHPLAAFDAHVHPTYQTSRPAVDKDNANGAWTDILADLDLVRKAEGGSRYYYGVINAAYASGVAGVGFLSGRAAIGWDQHGADLVAAHEWGHNWGRMHAPCNNAPNADTKYPYAGGTIGVYGFDVAAQSLKPRTWGDIMGYCTDEWISDYTYTAVLNFRMAQADISPVFSQAMQPCLLGWGRIEQGQPVLEPSFQVITRPSLPERSGPYTLEGRSADGTRLFHLDFAPEQVADDPRAAERFAFAVPLPVDGAPRLAAVRVIAPGGAATSLRPSAAARTGMPGIEIARTAPDRIALRWDASAHPMAMVRDPVTGQVLSLARGGHAEVTSDRRALDVQLSDGLGGRTVRVGVPAR